MKEETVYREYSKKEAEQLFDEYLLLSDEELKKALSQKIVEIKVILSVIQKNQNTFQWNMLRNIGKITEAASNKKIEEINYLSTFCSIIHGTFTCLDLPLMGF